jgi:mRNA interferase RelE/StbE
LKVQFRNSFLKDVKGLSSRVLKDRIKAAIAKVETAQVLREVGNLKKLKGSRGYYRIRIGDYRIALICEEDKVTFVRCLHRREIYRYLP